MIESFVRFLLLTLSSSKLAEWVATRFPPFRKMSRRFISGETLPEAQAVVEELATQGKAYTLDLLGENVDNLEDAVQNQQKILETLHTFAEHPLGGHFSIKPTQLGLDVDPQLCLELFEEIVEVAKQYGHYLRIDMEGSPYTQVTLDLYRKLHARYKRIGVVIQAYLHRSEEDIAAINAFEGEVRLCKGAYKESEEISWQEREKVSANYLYLARILLEKGTRPAFATHDDAMINPILEMAKELKVSPRDFEFQMLYNIRKELQDQLVKEGYRFRVYVPYGSSWFGYFMRRLAEKPANLRFFLTALLKG